MRAASPGTLSPGLLACGDSRSRVDALDGRQPAARCLTSPPCYAPNHCTGWPGRRHLLLPGTDHQVVRALVQVRLVKMTLPAATAQLMVMRNAAVRTLPVTLPGAALIHLHLQSPSPLPLPPIPHLPVPPRAAAR